VTAHFATHTPVTPTKPGSRFGLVILNIAAGDPIPAHRSVHAVRITPALAQDWLNRYADPKKRKVRPRVVERYAATMLAGEWLDQSSKVIDFTHNGTDRLSDGHHRLTAIVKSGVSVWMEVHFGSDPRSRQVEGVRVARTASDMLAMEGCPSSTSAIASASKTLFIYKQTEGTTTRWDPKALPMPDNEDIILSWMEYEPEWSAVGIEIIRIANKFPKGASKQAIQAAGILIERAYPGEAVPFLDMLEKVGGPVDGYGMPAYKTLESILRSGKVKRTGGYNRDEWARAVMTIIIRAFNAHKAGHSKWSRPEVTSANSYLTDRIA
jgi:hypothetical protein